MKARGIATEKLAEHVYELLGENEFNCKDITKQLVVLDEYAALPLSQAEAFERKVRSALTLLEEQNRITSQRNNKWVALDADEQEQRRAHEENESRTEALVEETVDRLRGLGIRCEGGYECVDINIDDLVKLKNIGRIGPALGACNSCGEWVAETTLSPYPEDHWQYDAEGNKKICVSCKTDDDDDK